MNKYENIQFLFQIFQEMPEVCFLFETIGFLVDSIVIFTFKTVIFILSLHYWTLITTAQIFSSLMTIALPVILFTLLAQ